MRTNKVKSVKVAMGGILAALSVIFMFFTSIFPSMTYAAPAVCGALLMVSVIEISSWFSLIIYAVVGFLSIFLVADKEAAIMYLLFFGYYPIIKGTIEGKLSLIPSWICKYIIFNIGVIVSYFICSKFLGIEYDEIGNFGKMSVIILLIMGNIIFAIYDLALTRLVSVYLRHWQKYVKRLFR